ncbi:unnamed protein product, partial [Amoebophrya sp. A25]
GEQDDFLASTTAEKNTNASSSPVEKTREGMSKNKMLNKNRDSSSSSPVTRTRFVLSKEDYVLKFTEYKKDFLQQTDQFGNSVLHLMTLHGRRELLSHVMATYSDHLDLFKLNRAGFAPIGIAAVIQNTEIFNL